MTVTRKAAASALALAATVICALPAAAGIRYGDPFVTITLNADGSGRAMGTLGGVRNSVDRVQRLSCEVRRTETVSAAGAVSRSVLVICGARDATARSVSCTSRLEAYADALGGADADSLLDFSFDAGGQCTSLAVYESSSLQRKGP